MDNESEQDDDEGCDGQANGRQDAVNGWLRWAAIGCVVIGTIGCDRATKNLAARALAGDAAHSFLADTIRLQLVQNHGGFLGLGANLPAGPRWAIFTLGTIVLLCGVALVLARYRLNARVALGLGLVWAGGVSNWLDRVVDGSVLDFLNVGVGSLRTGIFNVADMAIMVGVALVVLGRRGLEGRARRAT